MNDVAVLKAIMDPLLQLVSLVLIGLAPVFANYLIQILHSKAHVDLTVAQAQTVHDAADTAAGVLITQLARGEIQLAHLHVDNPAVIAAAQVAINAVPEAAGKLNVTIPDLAQIIVGRVGHAIAADPTTQTVGTPIVQVAKVMPAPAAPVAP